MLTGEGSRTYGGRWNRPRSFATVYASAEDSTALAEAKSTFVYYGLDPSDALPRVLIAIDLNFCKILDLHNPQVHKRLGVSTTRMRADDWRRANAKGTESLTQAIGRAAYLIGAEGLIVPACDGKKNVVWFPGNLATASNVTIRNENKLRDLWK